MEDKPSEKTGPEEVRWCLYELQLKGGNRRKALNKLKKNGVLVERLNGFYEVKGTTESTAPEVISVVDSYLDTVRRIMRPVEESKEKNLGEIKARALKDKKWLESCSKEGVAGALGYPLPKVRAIAAWRVGQKELYELTPILWERIKDKEKESRREAIKSLGRVGPRLMQGNGEWFALTAKKLSEILNKKRGVGDRVASARALKTIGNNLTFLKAISRIGLGDRVKIIPKASKKKTPLKKLLWRINSENEKETWEAAVELLDDYLVTTEQDRERLVVTGALKQASKKTREGIEDYLETVKKLERASNFHSNQLEKEFSECYELSEEGILAALCHPDEIVRAHAAAIAGKAQKISLAEKLASMCSGNLADENKAVRENACAAVKQMLEGMADLEKRNKIKKMLEAPSGNFPSGKSA